jgi:hypothetical protein
MSKQDRDREARLQAALEAIRKPLQDGKAASTEMAESIAARFGADALGCTAAMTNAATLHASMLSSYAMLANAAPDAIREPTRQQLAHLQRCSADCLVGLLGAFAAVLSGKEATPESAPQWLDWAEATQHTMMRMSCAALDATIAAQRELGK